MLLLHIALYSASNLADIFGVLCSLCRDGCAAMLFTEHESHELAKKRLNFTRLNFRRLRVFLAQQATYTCRAYATSMTSVRLSVCLSLTLVYCDRTVH